MQQNLNGQALVIHAADSFSRLGQGLIGLIERAVCSCVNAGRADVQFDVGRVRVLSVCVVSVAKGIVFIAHLLCFELDVNVQGLVLVFVASFLVHVDDQGEEITLILQQRAIFGCLGVTTGNRAGLGASQCYDVFPAGNGTLADCIIVRSCVDFGQDCIGKNSLQRNLLIIVIVDVLNVQENVVVQCQVLSVLDLQEYYLGLVGFPQNAVSALCAGEYISLRVGNILVGAACLIALVLQQLNTQAAGHDAVAVIGNRVCKPRHSSTQKHRNTQQQGNHAGK